MRNLLIVLVLLGCGATPPPHTPAPEATTAVAEAEPASPADPCGEAIGLVLTASDAHIECENDERRLHCLGTSQIRARNCSSTPLRIGRITLRLPSDTIVTWSFEPRDLAHGEAEEREWTNVGGTPRGQPVRYEVTAYYGPPADPEAESVETSFEIDEPGLREAIAACDRCEGDWAARGMLAIVGCNCRTEDAGNECRSADECRGQCLFDRYEREPQPDGYELATAVGHCHDHVMLFGCRARILESTQPQRVRPGVALRAPHSCVD